MRAVVQRVDPDSVEPTLAHVLYDGDSSWYVETPDLHEMTSPSSTVLVGADGVKAFRGHVSSSEWVKTMLSPERIAYLETSRGEHVGSALSRGRTVERFRVIGLRRGEPLAEFEIAVDMEHGLVMMLSALSQPGTTIEVVDITIGQWR